MLPDSLVYQCLVNQKKDRYKRLVEKSFLVIKDALAGSDSPCVAFSGGKDSTVVLDLVRKVDSSVVAQFGHEQWLLPETELFIGTITNMIKTALPDTHAEWFDVWRSKDEVPSDTIYIDPNLYNEFDYETKLLGRDLTFLGLRKAENKNRRLMLNKMGELFFCKRHGKKECNPISNWSDIDVWTYIIETGINYNLAYPKLMTILPLERCRIGPIAQGKVLQFGSLSAVKQLWPDFFNRFAAKYPEARNYV